MPSNLASWDMLAQLLVERLTVEIHLPPEGAVLVDALDDFLVPDEVGRKE
jgi:hypothetical protein